jgi:uncharacterized protein (TIGR02118 family)
MAQLLALYHQPPDPAAFDRYYFETHVPIAKKVPGLRSYIVNDGPLNLIAGSPAPYLIAELSFDTMETCSRLCRRPRDRQWPGI